MMIENSDDFCLWMYGVVDAMWGEIAPLFKRPGPDPECSDSELLTMAWVGEHRELFPVIATQSRFNRRRRARMNAFNSIRQSVLRMLDLSADGQCAIDSLPVPAVSSGAWFDGRLGRARG